MKILLAAAEVLPYSKTGGLADMVSALAKFLAKAGHRVGLVTPLYRGIADKHEGIEAFDWELDLPMGGRRLQASIRVARPRRNLTVYFIDQPELFDRNGLYLDAKKQGYLDNTERFLFFSKCVVNLARYLPWRPEIVHAHDWHVGPVPLLARHQAWHDAWIGAPKTVFTIHNLAYQGVSPVWKYSLTNLPWYYFNPDGAEYHAQFSPMKTGIAFADAVTTVSPTYAKEITTPKYGCGLNGLLKARSDVLTGILNGVDYDEWRTTRNPYLSEAFGAGKMAGKEANKLALRREMRLPASSGVPLFGTVSRLEEQKGVDLILGALEEMLTHEFQYVLLGSGQRRFEGAFRDLSKRYPGKVAVRIGYDTGLSHRIEAGSDFYLMPSRFEPCGLNQMYSLRYGTVPIVRATGGLDDAIVDAREDVESANGIKFDEPSSAALAKAIRKALLLYAQPIAFERFQLNGMARDFSWERSVEAYISLYEGLLS